MIKAKKRYQQALFVFMIFSGLYLITFLVYPQSEWNDLSGLPISKIVFDITSTLIVAICITWLCLYIDRRMNRSLPWLQYNIRRVLLQSFIQIVMVFILLFVFSIAAYGALLILKIDSEAPHTINDDVWYFLGSTVFLTLIISGINTINYLAANWKQEVINAAESKVNAAESKQVAAESELQALRLQLDPHFVFNSLSVLSELILKDQQLGFEYAEKFSKIYRYLLINSRKELISLREEIKFLNAYIYLLKARVDAGAIFEINVPSDKLDLNIAPVTLQLLVENAVKHNRIEKETPLHIKVYINENNELLVQNNILTLLKEPLSSGLGLQNILRRYTLLSDQTPMIEQTATFFTVRIPLLP